MPVNDTPSLLREIEEFFPFIDKPQGWDLMAHPGECLNCSIVRKDLEEYPGQELPKEGLRYLHTETSCLSPMGWAWYFPSLLRYCVGVNDTYDGIETEFLIYGLCPSPKFEHETRKHLSALNESQISCLIHFLEWCKGHPYWSEYCPEDIERAIEFMHEYQHNE